MRSPDVALAPARARRRVLAAATLLAVAAVAVAIVVAGRSGRGRTGAPRAGAFAATVQRRNLVIAENATGKISYAGASTVANRLQGTLTWTPAVGRVITPGHRLFAVDNFPVILLRGTTPAYRTLGPSDSPGPDVEQLNANLIELGFGRGGIVAGDEWQPATTAAVEAFQAANGEPQTGSLVLGTVVFLRGAQRVASFADGVKPVLDPVAGDHTEFVDYSAATPTPSPSATPTPTATPTPAPPARRDPAIDRLGSRVRQLQRENRRLQRAVTAARSRARANRAAPAGPVSGADSPVMTMTSTRLVVTVDVPAGQQDVTHVGARVPIVMPSGSTVHGHVARIGHATSTGGKSTVPITIHLDKRRSGRNLNQAAVSVRFVKKVARHALSVPVTALLAQPGGGYAVQAASAPYRLIRVTLGTFATGYVQVSGKGLRPGLRITNSQG